MRFLRQLALTQPPGIMIALLLAGLTLACVDKDAPNQGPTTPVQVAKAPPPSAPKAILLITIDTLRADHTGMGGYTLPTTPFLDELAKSGVNFTHAYANSSFTPTSMASIMTGLHSRSHGVENGYFDAKSGYAVQDKLPESIQTIAESLRDTGYRTVGVPSNRHLSRDLGFGQGFEAYYGAAQFGTADVVNGRVQAQMSQTFGSLDKKAWAQVPLFLWVHYFDPHAPYTYQPTWPPKGAPSPDKELMNALSKMTLKQVRAELEPPKAETLEALISLYDGNIRYTDDHIRTLWERYGFDDDTLVIVTSDHGEEFLEHGNLGHVKNLYDESVRVPFLIRWPRGLPQGEVIDTPISILDIFPTILDLTSAPRPDVIHGESLLPLIKGAVKLHQSPLLMELKYNENHWTAHLDGQKKAIRVTSPEKWVGVFDLQEDPKELRNHIKNGELAAAGEADKAAVLKMDHAFSLLPPPPSDTGMGTIKDNEEIEALKAMGYIE